MPAIAAQADYHHGLYHALWEQDFVAAARASGLAGLDQFGHFGSDGCDLVVDAIGGRRAGRQIRLAELGCGVGGALRYVVDALPSRGVPVELAVGLDAVQDHCRLLRRIDAANGGARLAVCTSVDRPGLRSASFDVVFATGSVSHFADMAATMAEAARLLRPGGLLTFTEEVSLLGSAGAPAERFRALHPPSVFFTASPSQRRGQLEAAGFVDVQLHDLTEWAVMTMRQRLLALRIYRQSLEELYGAAETQRIVDTIAAARDEFVSGRLVPAHVVASRP